MSAPANPVPLMLPGQAAAPEGPADLTMMYVLHHAFRRDLDDFVEAAGRLAVDERGSAWRRAGGRSGSCCTTTTRRRTTSSGRC